MRTRTIFLLAGLTILVAVPVLLFTSLVQPPVPVLEGDERPGVADEPEPEAPPPTVKASLGGIVVSHTGEPVPGATVVALVLGDDLWPVDQDAPLPASGVAGPKGDFSFPTIAPGDYMLRAREGERIGFLPLVRVRAGEPRSVVLRLLESAALTGRVVNFDGRPIRGAIVTTDLTGLLRPFYAVLAVPPPSLRDRFESKTDGGGTFRVSPLPRGPHDLKVSAPGMRDRVFLSVDAPTTALELALYPARSLRGAITWPGDSSPAEIEVCAEPLGVSTLATVRSAEAEFRLDGLIPGQYELCARAEGFAAARAEVVVETATEPELVRLLLTRGTPLSGIVTDPDGRPIEGARVVLGRLIRSLAPTKIDVARRLATRKDGTYATVVARGVWVAWAESEGFRPSDERIYEWPTRFARFSNERFDPPFHDPPFDEQFRIGASPVVRDFRLERQRVIRGSLRYPDGSPAIGAHVFVDTEPVAEPRAEGKKARPRGSLDNPHRSTTDRHGRFEVGQLQLAQRYRLWAWRGQYYGNYDAILIARNLAFGKEQTAIEVNRVIARGHERTVRGRVVDADGRGVPGAIVFMDIPIETGPDGRFERGGLPRDSFGVGALALGYALGSIVSCPFGMDGTTTLPDLRLERRGVSLPGRVLNARGEPIAGAWVGLGNWRAPIVHTLTAADGTFDLRGPGRWGWWSTVISVRAPGHARVEERVWQLPKAPLDITLPESGVIRGTLRAGPGVDLGTLDSGITVDVGLRSYFRGAYHRIEARFSSGGRRFEVVGIPPKSYAVQVYVTGCAAIDLGRQEVGESPLDLGELTLEPGGSIDGVLVGAEIGSGAKWKRIAIPELDAHADIGKGNRFRFDHVPPGTWTMQVESITPSAGQSMSVTVSAGQTTTIEFVVCQ